MEEKKMKGRASALLPIVVFLVFFLGAGFLTGDFYAMPAIVAFLIALLVAFCQNKELNFDAKIKVIAQGIADENVVTMLLIFLNAGAFSGIVTAAGGMDSTVNFFLAFLPSSVAVVGLFIIGCFISLSMGTSMGTIAALAPIAAGISSKTGFALPICIGAVVCGAMFGDNLSMISDTTIAAVKTQGCEMRDKFKNNFWIVFPAAVVTIIIFFALTRNGAYEAKKEAYNIWQVMPYLVVLVGALIGFNVFKVLIGGIVLSAVVGVATGSFAVSEIFGHLGSGITGMYDITVISVIVACIVSLVRAYGGIAYILEFIKKRIRGKRGGEFGIAFLTFLVDACTANNTVAIVMAGPIAKEISDEYGIDPRKSASYLDIFASVGQGLIPYGAQLLSAATLTGLTPFAIMPYLYYPILMAVCALAYIAFRKQKTVVNVESIKVDAGEE